MKTPLHLYTKEAFDILKDCFFYHGATNPLTVAIAPDGELQAERSIYNPDKATPVDIGTIDRYLAKYAKNSVEVVGRADLAAKAKCIRLIALGKDKTAKKRYPAEYEQLKGKPMNPLQVAAVSTLIQELSKLDGDVAYDFNTYGCAWIPRFCDSVLKRAIDELIGKITAIRGY